MRTRLVVSVCVLVLAACGQSGPSASSESASDPAGTDSSRPGDAKTVSDPKAGLTYAIPDGWSGPLTEGLVYFTSYISSEPTSDDPTKSSKATTSTRQDRGRAAAIAGAGTFQGLDADPGRDGLQSAAKSSAIGFAEFFIPQEGQRSSLVDEETQVSGHRAWHVRYRIVLDDPTERPKTVDLVAVDLSEPAYLLTVVDGEDADLTASVDSIIASLTAS
ncbi:MAG: hypothetical protein ABIV94_11220 [Acidimicrobiales bacterium]